MVVLTLLLRYALVPVVINFARATLTDAAKKKDRGEREGKKKTCYLTSPLEFLELSHISEFRKVCGVAGCSFLPLTHTHSFSRLFFALLSHTRFRLDENDLPSASPLRRDYEACDFLMRHVSWRDLTYYITVRLYVCMLRRIHSRVRCNH